MLKPFIRTGNNYFTFDVQQRSQIYTHYSTIQTTIINNVNIIAMTTVQFVRQLYNFVPVIINTPINAMIRITVFFI